MHTMKADVCILGSSFSGSLLAWLLASRGLRVVLVDRGRHPRFAIGESSTPVADLLLGQLADRWGLPELASLTRFGSWRRDFPELVCGKKRGFSYFRHRPDRPFTDSADHDASLLVAASSTDADSDTHWLRADVDQFFFDRAVAAGVQTSEAVALTRLEPESSGWLVSWRPIDCSPAHETTVRADVLIDASGGGGLLGRRLGLTRRDDSLATRTEAVYGHFRSVASWDALQIAAGNRSTTWPFASDDAAQHHLFDEGWLWMLRFVDDRCSVGIVRPHQAAGGPSDATQIWQATLARYPSVAALLAGSRTCEPLVATGRINRLWSAAAGPRWAMLPTTTGFVDPLHSTGIAHAIHGVTRLAGVLASGRDPTESMAEYGESVISEIGWVDLLVSAAYAVWDDFDLFVEACRLFFIATIDFEQRLGDGQLPENLSFLSADRLSLRVAVTNAREQLISARAATTASGHRDHCQQLREILGPWDAAGLFTAATPRRLPHTAVRKPADRDQAQSS